MSPSLYATSFSLKTLDHLGINLYGNAPAVIAELVANSHDAGAKRVYITITPGRIVVEDDGVGMSLVDINTKYLRFGYEKRRETTIIPITEGERTIQRHVMGRKGIGKISTLSIAREVEVQTVHEAERNGFIISLDIIRQLQEDNSTEYLPTPIPDSAISITKGTRIELRQLVDEVTGLDNTLRESLARMFPNTGNNVLFDIYVNDSPITIADRQWFEKIQFLWYFGKESEKFISYCPRAEEQFLVDNVIDLARDYTISGWLATTFFPSDVPVEQKIVPVYAQNKMIQRDLLYDYKNYKVSSSYLIGEVYAPFMDVDTEPDIVLSDRQRINPNDPRYIALRKHVVRQVEAIDKAWDALRKKSPNHRPRKKKAETPQASQEMTEQQGSFDNLASLEENTTSTQQNGAADPGANDPGINNEGNTETSAGSETTASNNRVDQGSQAEPDDRLRPPPPPAREAQATFINIRDAVATSRLEPEFKDIILYDLEQARLAYYNRAYKACVIMLGAVVEGLMLGTLRRPEVIDLMINDTNPPRSLRNMQGMRNPIYNDRSVFATDLGNLLGFEEYRQTIHHYVDQIRLLGINDVQRFRNAVHPWNCVQQPNIYGNYGQARALAHLASLEPLTNFLLAWTP